MNTIVATARQTAVPTHHPLAFGNTLRVETRKLFNTRAAQLIIAAGVALMAAFGGGLAWVSEQGSSLESIVATATGPGSWLLMVTAVLLVSAEFSRRTATHTFTLDPNRPRVLAAKVVVVLAAGLVAGLVALGIGLAAGTLVPALGGPAVEFTLGWHRFAQCLAGLCFAGLLGLAWGLLFRNAPAPLVLLLLWPTVSHILRNLSIAPLLDWINIEPVWNLDGSARSWAQLATSAALWLVLPGAVGAYRLIKGDL